MRGLPHWYGTYDGNVFRVLRRDIAAALGENRSESRVVIGRKRRCGKCASAGLMKRFCARGHDVVVVGGVRGNNMLDLFTYLITFMFFVGAWYFPSLRRCGEPASMEDYIIRWNCDSLLFATGLTRC